MKTLKSQTKIQINNFISNWHKNFIDVWWRRKYKIAFGSKVHREMNFLDMILEYQEELEINKQIYLNKVQSEVKNENYNGLSQEEIDKDYDNIDLDKFNE